LLTLLKSLLKKLHLKDNSNIYKELIDLAWINKDYKYLYKILWKLDRLNELENAHYSKLITLEAELNRGEKLSYLYKKVWNRTKDTSYIMPLLYSYMDRNQLSEFKSFIDNLTPKDKKGLETTIDYHILLANYYLLTSQTKRALKEFKIAFRLQPKSARVHQAYIWFLIDNRFNKLLKKELRVLRKNPKLQKQVGFPAVVASLMFQKTDLALKWIKPIPWLGPKLSETHFYYTPSNLNASMNFSEGLSQRIKRVGGKSPDSYNFGLNRNLSMDYSLVLPILTTIHHITYKQNSLEN